MPEWTIQILREVPALAVLGIIVFYGMRNMSAVHRDHLSMVSRISKECHEVQREARDAIRGNTEGIAQVTSVLGELKVLLQSINGYHRRGG
jgi:hypothetical protein